MISEEATITKAERVAYRETQEGGVLLNLDSGNYHGVNPIGALIWSLIDGQSMGDLIAAVREAVVDAPEGLQDEVMTFLENLAERNLIEIG